MKSGRRSLCRIRPIYHADRDKRKIIEKVIFIGFNLMISIPVLSFHTIAITLTLTLTLSLSCFYVYSSLRHRNVWPAVDDTGTAHSTRCIDIFANGISRHERTWANQPKKSHHIVNGIVYVKSQQHQDHHIDRLFATNVAQRTTDSQRERELSCETAIHCFIVRV